MSARRKGGARPNEALFRKWLSAATTALIILLLAFIAQSAIFRGAVEHWGRRCLLLLALGLFICCLAAARDGLDKTIQCAIDGSCAPGLFPLVSVPTLAGCAGAAVVLVSAIVAAAVKGQQAGEVCFFVMSGGVAAKILAVEIARIIMK